jgi:hypothetical protein
LAVRVDLTLPAVPDENCAVERTSTRVNYYCAVPVTELLRWSGQVLLSGFSKATSLADASASRFKVCRYTPDDRNLTVRPTTETAEYYNGRHPFRYLLVTSAQVNKNFLVISAGDGSSPYSCPDEDTATLIESNTWPHDPAT